jgi:hypothetical protein
MLPRYKISINPEDQKGDEKLGMTQIAYTANPAIITKGVYLNKIDQKFIFTDELKLIVAAPALIPNLPIYRNDEELGEYEVIFDEQTIEQLREDFMSNLNTNNAQFNIDHDSSIEAPSFILDSWITVDSDNDPSFTKYGVQVPKGSWFVVSKFRDKEYFINEIVNKERYAYSIEGFLGLALNNTNKNKQKMTKQKFERATLEDGTTIYVSALEVGGEVMVIDENGDKVPVFDAEHILSDGTTVVTVDGKITEIRPFEEMVKEEMVEVENQKMEYQITDEERTAIISEVMQILDPKFEELYKVIAELKTVIEGDVVEDDAEIQMETKLSAVDTLSNFFKMNKI